MNINQNIESEQNILKTIDALFDDNNPKGAEAFMLEMKEKASIEGNDSTELTVLNELIGYYRQTSEKEKLIAIINDALALLEKMNDNESLKYATVILNIANAYRSLGKYDDADKYYDITDIIYEKKIASSELNRNDLIVAGLYNNRSLLCQEQGNPEKAEEYLLKALPIVTSLNAGFEIAVTYANLANTCVLAKSYSKAKEYAYTAIRLFKARALKDPHYCAALSALATCYFEEGDFTRASVLIEEAMEIIETTIGRNFQYLRLEENLSRCKVKINSKVSNGMELAKAYYEEYGKNMIHDKFPEYEDKIAVGLCGEGSDCFGYDDSLSSDHDFGPDFCMFITDETYDAIGDNLQKAYDELPLTFRGYTRTVTRTGAGRRGVIRISDFYRKFIGADFNILDEINDEIFAKSEDYALAAATNGEIFRDDEGIFSSIRNELKKGYPSKLRMLKIAQAAANFSQCAQYNYIRMLNREDEVTASIMLSDGIKNAMKLYHYICNVYPPHDKWLYKSTKSLDKSGELTILIDQITGQFVTKIDKKDVVESIEKLGEFFAVTMYDEGIISDVEPYLDYHTEEIIFKSGIIELSDEEIVNKIAQIEFNAFDKVENEGGRAYCQNDWPTFSVMRKSQYLTWNHEMLVQYYYDFTREFSIGHNLITEKYGRMMESTDPDRWNEIKVNFPELSEEKKSIIEQIVGIQMQMMESFAKEHPGTASNARILHTSEDTIYDTSYETYLRGEISTYSDKMLQLYGQYVVNAYKNGINIAYITMDNTAKLYGFDDLISFETFKRKIKK